MRIPDLSPFWENRLLALIKHETDFVLGFIMYRKLLVLFQSKIKGYSKKVSVGIYICNFEEPRGGGKWRRKVFTERIETWLNWPMRRAT